MVVLKGYVQEHGSNLRCNNEHRVIKHNEIFTAIGITIVKAIFSTLIYSFESRTLRKYGRTKTDSLEL